MRRHLRHVAWLVIFAAPAWAQVPSEPRSADAVVANPGQAAAPGARPVTPVPGPIVASPGTPQNPDKFDLKIDGDRLKALAVRLPDDLRAEIERAMADAKEQALLSADDARRSLQMALQDARIQIETIRPSPTTGTRPVEPMRVIVAGDLYTRGLNAVSQRQYDRAITTFDQVIAAKGSRIDAALYWKAFAQFKLGKTSEALAAVAQLRKEYAQSAYLKDAGVLEADARRTAGQPVNPASLQDADIKLLAIQSLQNQKSPNVVPLLEGVLTATNELEVKKRALYVLALSEEPQAHQLLLRYAKGGGNPDLQVEAIRRLGSRGDEQTASSTELRDIYAGTSDAAVKRAVIDALRSSMNKTDVVAMYQKETDRTLKMQMLNVLGSMRAADEIAQIVRTEKDAAVRQRAIRALGSTRVESTRQMLVDLYTTEQDKETRKIIISTMAEQNNAEGLIALGRKETAPDVKVEIVRRLSEMARTSKAAADYMAELLK